MRFLYADGNPSILTFKRLMLVSKELTFIDEAGFSLGEYYTMIGQKSPITKLLPEFDQSPIKLKVENHLSFDDYYDLFEKYFEYDILNHDFMDLSFSKYLQVVKETEKKWLIENQEKLKNHNYTSLEFLYTKNSNDPLLNFGFFLFFQSIQISNILIFCSKNDCMPISQDPYVLKLLNTRLKNSISSQKTLRLKQLDLKLMDCFIPDEALNLIQGRDLLNFRYKISDYFDAFSVEINKIETILLKDGLILSEKDITNLIDIELNPKLQQIKIEILKVRNDMFKDILKLTKNLFISGVLFSSLFSVNFWGALSSFLISNLKSPKFLDSLIDNKFKIKDVYESNSLAYLLKIQEKIK
jgi:hypothetical protein